MNIRIKKSTLKISLVSLLLVGGVFLTMNQLASRLPQADNINLLTIFLTGLLTGGLTCLAVQGGLLAATIAQREEEKLIDKTRQTGNAVPILSFLAAKLIAYTILGLLLGYFGSLFQFSLTAQVIMQLAVVIFMFGTAGNILNIHPVFRYFVIQPPKFLTRLVRKQSKSPLFANASWGKKDFFAPALLGAFTVFIPCGTTQAMMALAIGSGSPLLGAAVLFAFVLGTSPLFFTLGYFATKLGDTLHEKFMKIAAFSLIFLALYTFYNTLALTGITFSLPQGLLAAETRSGSVSAVSEATIEVLSTSYSPNVLNVKKGSTVKLRLVNNDAYTCAQAFTIPQLGIQRVVPVGSEEIIEFVAPDTPDQIAFMCSMGMYRGVINVI